MKKIRKNEEKRSIRTNGTCQLKLITSNEQIVTQRHKIQVK